MGQNFLVDPRTAERIVAAAGIRPEETVVEIGPGLGALTFHLARTGARLIALETDRDLARILSERLGRKLKQRVEVVRTDALAFDLAQAGSDLVIVGNLPYQISSPLIFKLLSAGPVVGRAVLTLQQELADRLASPPGSKTYGLISVLVQLKARVEPLFTLPPGAFHPRPKVSSRTIRLTFNQPPPLELADSEAFERLVRAAFNQRRKTIRQALLGAPLGLTRERLEEGFSRAGINPTLRAEMIPLEGFIALSNHLLAETA